MIKVRGSFTNSYPPDWVEIRIELQSIHPDYDVAIHSLNSRVEDLTQDVLALGYKEEDLETVDFRVETLYKYEGNTRRFSGYQVTQLFRLSFKLDHEQLNETMTSLASSTAKPNLNLIFTVSNPTTIEKELLVKAIENAKDKALAMAQALDVGLGTVISAVEVTENQVPFQPRGFATMEAAVQINPAGIPFTKEVEVSWEIIAG